MDGSTPVASRTSWLTIGWTGRLTASWSLAGGVAAGLLVTLLFSTGRLHPMGVPAIAAALALLGSTLGATHGAILGALSRPRHERQADIWTSRLLAFVCTAGAFALAILLGLWLATSAIVAATGNRAAGAGLILATVVSLGILLWASTLGWRAFEIAFARWPERRLGALLVSGTFLLLLIVFLAIRPALPGRQAELSTFGSVLLAVLATLWVTAPAVVVMLGWRRSLRHSSSWTTRGDP